MGLALKGPDKFCLTVSRQDLQRASDMMAVRLAHLEVAMRPAMMALSSKGANELTRGLKVVLPQLDLETVDAKLVPCDDEAKYSVVGAGAVDEPPCHVQ